MKPRKHRPFSKGLMRLKGPGPRASKAMASTDHNGNCEHVKPQALHPHLLPYPHQ